MKSVLFFALTFFTAISQTQEIRKILDGNVIYCPPSEEQKAFSKQVTMALLGVQKFSDRTEVRLQVRLVQCEKGFWQIDQNPTSSVFAEYKNFELLVVDSGSNVLGHRSLSQVEQTGTQEVTILISNPKVEKFEIFVRVLESVNTPGVGKETGMIVFGSYLVNLR